MFTDCYCTQFRRSAQALTVIYDAALKDENIRISQFSTLRALDRLGAATMQELAEEVALDKTTISRNVKVLDQNGWVLFSQGKDLRQKIVKLSPKGKQKLASATTCWQKAQTKIQQSAAEIFTDFEGDPLLETLEKLQQISGRNFETAES